MKLNKHLNGMTNVSLKAKRHKDVLRQDLCAFGDVFLLGAFSTHKTCVKKRYSFGKNHCNCPTCFYRIAELRLKWLNESNGKARKN